MKLTIAIPTYNRVEYLIQCLESILSQITDEVEVIVSDNCSEDSTEEIIKKQYFNQVKYYRHKQNVGMDLNFLNCLEKASGDYILIMSDDDIMIEGTVDKIIKVIDNDSPDFLMLNSSSFCGNYENPTNCSNCIFDLDSDFLTTDKDSFVEKVSIWITFLSALVFKKENVKNVKHPDQYAGTYFLQSHVALLSTKGAGKKLEVISKNCIAARNGNSGGYNLYKVWVRSYKKLLMDTAVRAGYSSDIMKKIFLKTICKNVRNFIIEFRINNSGFELNNPEILLKETWKYPSVWLGVYPWAFLPVGFLKFAVSLKKRL